MNQSSFDDKQEVRDFIQFMLDSNTTIAEEARFVGLSADQLAEEQSKFDEATS